MTPQEQREGQLQSVGATDTVRDQDKIMVVLAYLFPLSAIPLLTVKDSDFVKWHSKQGLVLGAVSWVVMVVLGFFTLGLSTCLLGPAFLVLSIMGIMKGLAGKRWRIPVVADLADKF